jgi:uncharacterized protein (TIGR02588 family)
MSKKEQGGKREGRPAAEWVAFGIASALVLAVISAIVVEWLRPDVEPPRQFELSVVEVLETPDAYHATVRVRNTGTQTAENVKVRAELRVDRSMETSEHTLRFLAGHDAAELVYVFGEDPRQGRLDVSVVSYLIP